MLCLWPITVFPHLKQKATELRGVREAGEVWTTGKQMHVLLRQESSQRLPADALEKRFHLIYYMFFFLPFSVSIPKGRALG